MLVFNQWLLSRSGLKEDFKLRYRRFQEAWGIRQDLGVGEMLLLWMLDDVGLGWFAEGLQCIVDKLDLGRRSTHIKNSDGPTPCQQCWKADVMQWCALQLSGIYEFVKFESSLYYTSVWHDLTHSKATNGLWLNLGVILASCPVNSAGKLYNS